MDGLMELRSLITEYIMKNYESDEVGNYLTKLEDDDAFLERYLRIRQGNAKKAWELLKRYAQNRVEYPEIFPEKKSDHIKQLLKKNIVAMLKSKDAQGRRVCIVSTSLWDVDKCSIEDLTIVITSFLEATILEDDKNPPTGLVIVQNSDGIEMKHVRQFTIHSLRRWSNIMMLSTSPFFKHSLPLETKALVYVNVPPIFTAVIGLVRPLLPGDLKIHAYGVDKGFSDLHEMVPKEILPKEYGGPLNMQDAIDQNILARALA